MGLTCKDVEPVDPGILEAYQNCVSAKENPVGFFEGLIAALDNMEIEDQEMEANIPCQMHGAIAIDQQFGSPLTVACFPVAELPSDVSSLKALHGQ